MEIYSLKLYNNFIPDNLKLKFELIELFERLIQIIVKAMKSESEKLIVMVSRLGRLELIKVTT